MGTVIFWLTDDKGIQHTFTLKEIIYMKGSPVNILSTRRLSELYPDARGQSDVAGTGIHSRFNTHVLTWNHKKHSKAFSTAGSGLPECLFNTGYSRFQTYTSLVGKYYDDSTS